MEFKVAEKFVSINGEGTKAGQPAVFIRLAGCNLRCSYCDTMWANSFDAPHKIMTEQEIAEYVRSTGITNVTLTGGEPLMAENVSVLLSALSEKGAAVEIETNGSADISVCDGISPRPSVTMDYKLPSSGMEGHMRHQNFSLLESTDTVKFVAGSNEDLERALEIIKQYELTNRCRVFFSPVFGKIDPAQIVDFILKNKLNGVNFQLQLHKFIWDPDKRGV
ncbi:MAG: putative 7-carboxy-7-deazaguanine synthase QueE [Oscillospiraceae bacterium]|nr:putative 7-carboxy-7-deazaguanine synthase QueE [Oscillospiraceae bacterium]MDY6207544.1 putative 7-carboxy-7-deazaguanine synthase QueE [Oscillospiraceae bacterium]